jgi:hypothetical protein
VGGGGKGNRRSFDSLRYASVAPDDTHSKPNRISEGFSCHFLAATRPASKDPQDDSFFGGTLLMVGADWVGSVD